MSSNGNDTLREWSKIVGDWDWKMSAAGFFVVDRSLMSGVSYPVNLYCCGSMDIQAQSFSMWEFLLTDCINNDDLRRFGVAITR